MSVIGKRLKEARLEAGLSQEQLGVRAGIEEDSASARMNRYERGTRSPGFDLLQRIGNVLDLPVTYFYSSDDAEAQLLIAFHRMSSESKRALLEFAANSSYHKGRS
jgi:transcriptional regulator with XRE-family HTH domain